MAHLETHRRNNSPSRLPAQQSKSNGKKAAPVVVPKAAWNGDVLIGFHNDLVDADNLTSKTVWSYMVEDAKKHFPAGTIWSVDISEPHNVNFATVRLQGVLIPTVLAPLCGALFNKKNGLVGRLLNARKLHFSEHADPAKKKAEEEARKKNLDVVYQRNWINPASTFVRGDLDSDLVNWLMGSNNVIHALKNHSVEKPKKDDNGKPVKGADGKPVMVTVYPYKDEDFDKAWFTEQLERCIRPDQGLSWQRDSLVGAKLTVHDYREAQRELGLEGAFDEYFLDEHLLDDPALFNPLSYTMEHPEWLLSRSTATIEAYKNLINDEPNEKTRGDAIHKLLNDDLKKLNYNIPAFSYAHWKELCTKAKVIIMFGGSTQSLTERMIKDGFGPKIFGWDGQGGTKDPAVNLTGNTFNWDLNSIAAFNTLTAQAAGKGMPLMTIGTTELGKQVEFDGAHVEKMTGKRGKKLGHRIALYQIADRINPEPLLLDPTPDAYLARFKTAAVFCPDLAALLAVYAPTTFQKKYATKWTPQWMRITMHHRKIFSHKNEKGEDVYTNPIGTERVRFLDTHDKDGNLKTDSLGRPIPAPADTVDEKGHPLKDEHGRPIPIPAGAPMEHSFACNGKIVLWMPQGEGLKVKSLQEMLPECAQTLVGRIAKHIPRINGGNPTQSTAARSNPPTKRNFDAVRQGQQQPRRTQSQSQSPPGGTNNHATSGSSTAPHRGAGTDNHGNHNGS